MLVLRNTADIPIPSLEEALELKLRSLKIKRWLRTDEVALYLGKKVGAIKVMVHRGQLRRHKYFGCNYYDRDELDRLLENSREGKKVWR